MKINVSFTTKILCFLGLFWQSIALSASDSLFVQVDAFPNEEGRAEALTKIYGIEWRDINNHETLKLKYSLEKDFLSSFPKHHADILMNLSASFYIKGNEQQYKLLKKEALNIDQSPEFKFKLDVMEGYLLFKHGKFGRAYKYFKSLENDLEALKEKQGFYSEVIVYYQKIVGLQFILNLSEDLGKNTQKAFSYYKNYKEKTNEMDAKRISHIIAMNIQCSLNNGDPFKSMQFFVNCFEDDLFESENAVKAYGSFYILMVLSYKELGMEERSNEYYHKYKGLSEEFKDPSLDIYLETVMAYNQEHWEEMRVHLALMEEQIQVSPIYNGILYPDWYTLQLSFFYEQNILDSAIIVAQQYLDLSEATSYNQGLYEAYSTLGKCYKDKKLYAQSGQFYRSAMEKAVALKNPKNQSECLMDQIELAKATGDTDALVEFQDNLLAIKEIVGVSEQDKKAVLAYMEESEQKMQQLKKLKEEKMGALEASKEGFRNLKILAILIMITFLLLGWLFYKRQMADQLKKNKLAMIIEVLESDNNMLTTKQNVLQQEKEDIANKLEIIKEKNQSTEQLLLKLNESVDANSWEDFNILFHALHPDYIPNLISEFPRLSKTQQMYAMCMKMGLSIKQTSSLLYVSERTVKDARWRMKKLMNLDQKERIANFLQHF